MPIPDTAKWEEKLLKVTIENIRAQINVAILAANSLGKKNLQKELEQLKQYMQTIYSFFFRLKYYNREG